MSKKPPRTKRPRREPPPVLVEFAESLQEYVDAREDDTLTRAIRNRAQQAWLAIKDNPFFEPSTDAIELMEEVMRPLN